MKSLLPIIVSVFAITSAFAAAAARPNIVLIFADDLGLQEVGYQGADFYETPNIDRLAKAGMVFSNAYAAAGNCQPSRACLLSGQYTPRHGLFAVGSTHRGPLEEMRLIPIPNVDGLRSENVTVAEALKAAGYVTGIFGKWHLSEKPGVEPDQQGFDTVFESFHGWKTKEDNNPKGIYSLTKAAGEFMEKNKDRPFFLYLPHYAIHASHQSTPASLAKFKAKAPGKQHTDANLAACLYDFDDGVGILLKKLKELGLEENTLVVFTSDNGGIQKPNQEPLRGSKGSLYEGGIREPFIARWPGVIQPGSRCDVPVISQDLYPTFLATAGATPPAGKVLDGENLLPLFKGGSALTRQAIFWHFPGYLDGPVNRGRALDVRTGFRNRPESAIRKGDWKLHLYYEEWVLDGGRGKLATNHAVELYNLKDDLGERVDLANKNTAKRDELLDDLLAWQKAINAPVPTQPNPKYAPGTASNKKGKKPKDSDE